MPAPFLNPNDPQVHLVQEYGPYGYQPKLAPAVVFTVGELGGSAMKSVNVDAVLTSVSPRSQSTPSWP